MNLSAEQTSRCNKGIYIILVIVTVLFTVRNIQSYISGNLYGSIVAIIFLFFGIVTATLLYCFTKEKSATIYFMCSIGLVIYAAELLTHKTVADYSLIIPFIILALLTFNLKFIGIFGALAVGIDIVNVVVKISLYDTMNMQATLNANFFILLIVVTVYGMARITSHFLMTSKKLQEESLEHQKKVASTVLATVADFSDKFNKLLEDIKEVDQEANTNSTSLKAIADSQEETVAEINQQVRLPDH